MSWMSELDAEVSQTEAAPHFLEYCPPCGRKHYMKYQSCPTCNVYETAQPVSEKVYAECRADYSCDGCQTYREHL